MSKGQFVPSFDDVCFINIIQELKEICILFTWHLIIKFSTQLQTALNIPIKYLLLYIPYLFM